MMNGYPGPPSYPPIKFPRKRTQIGATNRLEDKGGSSRPFPVVSGKAFWFQFSSKRVVVAKVEGNTTSHCKT